MVGWNVCYDFNKIVFLYWRNPFHACCHLFLVAITRLYTLPYRPVRRYRNIFELRFSHYCSCPSVRDWVAVYPALFVFQKKVKVKKPSLVVVKQTKKALVCCHDKKKRLGGWVDEKRISMVVVEPTKSGWVGCSGWVGLKNRIDLVVVD